MVNRPPRLARLAVVATLAVALLCAALSACSRAGPATSPSPRASAALVTAAEAERLVDAAAAAIDDDDHAAFRAALPSQPTASAALEDLYRHLAPLTWQRLDASVTAIPGKPGVFDVRFNGSFGAGPPDRIVAERVLQFSRQDGGLSVAGDLTPGEVARQHLIAFHQPRQIVKHDAVVIFDRAWRARAIRLAKLLPAALDHVDAYYGLRTARPVALFLFSSRVQVTDSIGIDPERIDHRIKFFSRTADRLAHDYWSPADVGVVAPELDGLASWAPTMLRHELAHAATFSWFADARHAPDFLQEGLAVAAEGARDYGAIQAAVHDDPASLPLLEAMQVGDIWASRDTKAVRLAYAQAGATISYVHDGWGPVKLQRWARAIADTGLGDASIRKETHRVLGISWQTFQAGWRRYVLAM